MIALAVVSALTVGGLLYLLRGAYSQIERIQAASELARQEQAHRASEERIELLNRIQAPEAAPYMNQVVGKQYVSAEDDEEGWNAMTDA